MIRSSFRFSIRELLLCTLVVALVVALYLSRRSLAQAKTWKGRALALQEILEGDNYKIEYDPKSRRLSFWKYDATDGRLVGGGGKPTDPEYYEEDQADEDDGPDAALTTRELQVEQFLHDLQKEKNRNEEAEPPDNSN